MFQLQFHWYGFFVGCGVMVAVLLFEWLMKQEKLHFSLNWLALWLFIPGVIGARLYHLMTDWQLYKQASLVELLAVWNGGIGVIGALLGGVVGLMFFLRTQQLWEKQWIIFDMLALCIPIAQAIGRWGNFFNQELYGVATTLPWGISIQASHLLSGFDPTARYHPLFLYESIVMLLLGCALWALYYKKWWGGLGSGLYVAVYGMYYAMARFLLEFLRVESSRIGIPVLNWLTTAQWMMIVLFFVSLSLLVFRMRQTKERYAV